MCRSTDWEHREWPLLHVQVFFKTAEGCIWLKLNMTYYAFWFYYEINRRIFPKVFLSYKEVIFYPSFKATCQCSLILDIGIRTKHPSGILRQKWSAFFKYFLTFHYFFKNLWVNSLELWECNNINSGELEFKLNLRNFSSNFQHYSEATFRSSQPLK